MLAYTYAPDFSKDAVAAARLLDRLDAHAGRHGGLARIPSDQQAHALRVPRRSGSRRPATFPTSAPSAASTRCAASTTRRSSATSCAFAQLRVPLPADRPHRAAVHRPSGTSAATSSSTSAAPSSKGRQLPVLGLGASDQLQRTPRAAYGGGVDARRFLGLPAALRLRAADGTSKTTSAPDGFKTSWSTSATRSKTVLPGLRIPAKIVAVPREQSLAVRVLGPYGGSAPGYRMTTFLIDGETALDAGALTEALPLSAQRRHPPRRPDARALRPHRLAAVPRREPLRARRRPSRSSLPRRCSRPCAGTSSTTRPGPTSRASPRVARPTIRYRAARRDGRSRAGGLDGHAVRRRPRRARLRVHRLAGPAAPSSSRATRGRRSGSGGGARRARRPRRSFSSAPSPTRKSGWPRDSRT